MAYSQREAMSAGEDVYWWRGWVECSACGHRQESTIEVLVEHQEPIVPLECAECGGMTCTPE